MCERWVGDQTKTATYWPPPLAPPAIAVRLSRSAGLLNRGPGPKLSAHSSIWNADFKLWTPTALNFLSPGLYNNFTSTYILRVSQFALNSTPRPSRSPLISWYLQPDAPVIYTGAFLLLTAWLGWRSICNTNLCTFFSTQLKGLTFLSNMNNSFYN